MDQNVGGPTRKRNTKRFLFPNSALLAALQSLGMREGRGGPVVYSESNGVVVHDRTIWPGLPAYLVIENEKVFEIDLTPDGANGFRIAEAMRDPHRPFVSDRIHRRRWLDSHFRPGVRRLPGRMLASRSVGGVPRQLLRLHSWKPWRTGIACDLSQE